MLSVKRRAGYPHGFSKKILRGPRAGHPYGFAERILRGPRAHFVGIGGIGMSALAQWLRADGWTVSGTDRAKSVIVDLLERSGIRVTIAEETSLPRAIDLLVFSEAVPPTHVLRRAARSRGVREVSYAVLLGELTGPFRTLAIAGSHGKSTTTALAGLLLEAAGRDPSVVVGTRVPQWERKPRASVGDSGLALGNFRRGSSDVAVVEADEYRGHFLTLAPQVAVVTSLDHDHPDAFPTPVSYREVFVKFLARVRAGGTVVLPALDVHARKLRGSLRSEIVPRTFAVSTDSSAADVVASPPTLSFERQEFHLTVDRKSWGRCVLSVPGEHVVADAAAAIAGSLCFGLAPAAVRRSLKAFRGTWRRFEHVGWVNGAPVVSDYAHHPTELRALLRAARQWYSNRRLILLFQPHQHARSRAFAKAFLEALKLSDVVFLTEVYDVAGREESKGKVRTEDWVRKLKTARVAATHLPTLEEARAAVEREARPEDVVLVAGAGNIDEVARALARGGEVSASGGS